MKIYILGCSHSSGVELYDENLFENYWDFKTNGFKMSYEQFIEHQKIINKKYNGDLIKYEEDCRKLNWVTSLAKKTKGDHIVIDHSEGGVGISFFQFLYNNYKEINSAPSDDNKLPYYLLIKNRKQLKEYILESDLLIWQLTTEPRYFINLDNILIIGHDKAALDKKLQQTKEIPKWKRKILLDYYRHISNESLYMKDLMNFVNLIVCQRSLAKKKTVFFSFKYSNFYKYEFEPIKNKYTDWLFMDSDENSLTSHFIKNKIVNQNKSLTKYNHVSKQVHDATANYFYDYIRNLK